MRTGIAAFFTVILVSPSLLAVVEGSISIDTFGIRFLVATLIGIFVGGLVVTFIEATKPAKQSAEVPKQRRRKTDPAPQPTTSPRDS